VAGSLCAKSLAHAHCQHVVASRDVSAYDPVGGGAVEVLELRGHGSLPVDGEVARLDAPVVHLVLDSSEELAQTSSLLRGAESIDCMDDNPLVQVLVSSDGVGDTSPHPLVGILAAPSLASPGGREAIDKDDKFASFSG